MIIPVHAQARIDMAPRLRRTMRGFMELFLPGRRVRMVGKNRKVKEKAMSHNKVKS
jgi:hypothetical protein